MKKLSRAKRRGSITALTIFISPALVAMMAFSVDIGYILSVKSELQNAADAAALAGAEQLQTLYVEYYAPGQTQQQQIYTNATTGTSDSSWPIPTAQRFCGYNQAGNEYLSLPASDVTFSYYDGTTFSDPSYPSKFPNTVNVTTRRDSNANGALGLFFAKVFGVGTIDLTATSSATIYAGDVSTLQVIPGVNAHILPVALDVNVWTQYHQGNFTSSWLTGLISDGPNNAKQLQIYPFGANTPGSFGLLDVGLPLNNAPAFRQWITSGETPNDITYLLNHSLLPVSVSAAKSWKCGPGLTDTLLSSFQAELNKPNLIPLFQPASPAAGASSPGTNYNAASGNGQNATYSIVGFVGVTLTEASGNGSGGGGNGNGNGNGSTNSNSVGMTIAIQPSAIVDPTAGITNPKPATGTTLSQLGTTQTTFVSAKLTQ